MNQEQLRKEAAEKYASKFTSTVISSNEEIQKTARQDFIAGAEFEAEREKWKPISELDLSTPTTVQRWHRMWKCPISVWFNKEDSSFQWYEKSLTNRWPEEAFEPFYLEMPTPPKTSKQ